MAVPVIAVLTKYEALIDRVKDRARESGGRPATKQDVISYLDESVICSIKKTAHPPAAYVQTHRRYLSMGKVSHCSSNNSDDTVQTRVRVATYSPTRPTERSRTKTLLPYLQWHSRVRRRSHARWHSTGCSICPSVAFLYHHHLM